MDVPESLHLVLDQGAVKDTNLVVKWPLTLSKVACFIPRAYP